ncbi:TRAP transporter substrate-binding protein [Lachnoclostridium edouardi]|uniref:TRAP transporter substrate-binding protein n=1 Tax=Lachnoclostridium edouardi TaxID=1926283 RepID=UPI000C7B21C2|nr:TRAP transporter substrate-binding protein [Lachnoclostridium edouardi]MDO4278363.1 TRAP transporter substrate-binding protein [Lachnoclostridium edouardi]
MKKIISTVMALSLALSLAGCGGGSSSDSQTDTKAQAEGETVAATGEDYGEYKWTAAMTVAETTTNYKMMEKFAQLLNEKSGGTITIDIYPGGQLGNTTEFTEAVVGGSIEIGTGMTTDLVDFVPEMGLFDMPNLFKDIDQMRSLLTSDYVETMNDYCEAAGVHMLGFSDAGFRQLTTNKKVETLDDLKGQKVRTMTNQYHIAYWNALGASATPMQFTEVFMALQQNTIDGEENPYMNIVGNNIQEVQKYVVETNHLGHIITFFMNNDLYQSLPDNTKALVDECAAEAVAYAAQVSDESIEADKQTCIDAGCEIITLSDEDYAKLQSEGQVVYDMVRSDLGDEKVDTLLDAVAALN